MWNKKTMVGSVFVQRPPTELYWLCYAYRALLNLELRKKTTIQNNIVQNGAHVLKCEPQSTSRHTRLAVSEEPLSAEVHSTWLLKYSTEYLKNINLMQYSLELLWSCNTTFPSPSVEIHKPKVSHVYKWEFCIINHLCIQWIMIFTIYIAVINHGWMH